MTVSKRGPGRSRQALRGTGQMHLSSRTSRLLSIRWWRTGVSGRPLDLELVDALTDDAVDQLARLVIQVDELDTHAGHR